MSYFPELDPMIRQEMSDRFESSLKKNLKIFTKTEEAKEEPNEADLDIEFSFGIPLLIIATKSDMLDNLNEEKSLDYI